MSLASLLWLVVVVLIVLWLIGLVSNFAAGSPLIHALLVIALIVVVINLLTGRRAV